MQNKRNQGKEKTDVTAHFDLLRCHNYCLLTEDEKRYLKIELHQYLVRALGTVESRFDEEFFEVKNKRQMIFLVNKAENYQRVRLSKKKEKKCKKVKSTVK